MPTQHRDDLVDPAAGAEPDFKTIADFRKNNSRAIREVCREFVALCFAVHSCEHVGHDARRDRVTSFENEADCSPSECESCLGSSAFRPPYHMNLQISHPILDISIGSALRTAASEWPTRVALVEGIALKNDRRRGRSSNCW